MSKIHYSDHLERMIGETLEAVKIEFVHESEAGGGLDFCLPSREPGNNLYIEVKQYHTERISEQMKQQENIIVLQGKKAVEYFCKLLEK